MGPDVGPNRRIGIYKTIIKQYTDAFQEDENREKLQALVKANKSVLIGMQRRHRSACAVHVTVHLLWLCPWCPTQSSRRRGRATEKEREREVPHPVE